VFDGKKIKNAAKRLIPTRGFSGTLLGAKTLAARGENPIYPLESVTSSR
jgi:hypothetical protein